PIEMIGTRAFLEVMRSHRGFWDRTGSQGPTPSCSRSSMKRARSSGQLRWSCVRRAAWSTLRALAPGSRIRHCALESRRSLRLRVISIATHPASGKRFRVAVGGSQNERPRTLLRRSVSPVFLSRHQSKRLRAADGEQYRIERRRRGDVQPVALRTAEAQVGDALGQHDPADQRAVALVAMDCLAGAGPDAVIYVDAQAVVHAVSA